MYHFAALPSCEVQRTSQFLDGACFILLLCLPVGFTINGSCFFHLPPLPFSDVIKSSNANSSKPCYQTFIFYLRSLEPQLSQLSLPCPVLCTCDLAEPLFSWPYSSIYPLSLSVRFMWIQVFILSDLHPTIQNLIVSYIMYVKI